MQNSIMGNAILRDPYTTRQIGIEDHLETTDTAAAVTAVIRADIGTAIDGQELRGLAFATAASGA
jgi:hypothetical protein